MDKSIKKWGTCRDNNTDSFVFKIITDADDPKRARAKIQQFTKLTSDWMKPMGESLKFPIKLTTYVARHSFATMVIRSGAPIAFASQTPGHSNILTTQRYFGGFDLKTHSEYTKALTNFNMAEDSL